MGATDAAAALLALGITLSSGGNGAADSGKVVLFGSAGEIVCELLGTNGRLNCGTDLYLRFDSVNYFQFTGTPTGANVITVPDTTGTLAMLGAQTFTGAQTFSSAGPQIICGIDGSVGGSIKLFGSTSGNATLAPASVAGSSITVTLPAVTGTLALLGANTFTGIQTFTPTARSSGSASYFVLTTPADTTLAASTESIGASFTAATRQFSTGALTLQRERVFAAPTYSFAGASTLTTAVNVDIADPVAGTNATLTNKYALKVASQLVGGFLYFGAVGSSDWVTQQSSGTTIFGNGGAYTFATNASECRFRNSIGSSGSPNIANDVNFTREAAGIMRLDHGTTTSAATFKIRGTVTGTKDLCLTHNGTNGVISVTSGNLHITNLPTSNPGPGILWNNAGTPAIGT